MNQERTSDRLSVTQDSPGNPGSSDAEILARTTPANPPDQPAQTASLTVSQLAVLGASNNSTPIFQQHAAHTLRAELDAQALLIIDYPDAFGTSVVRAVSGADQAAVGSEIWCDDAF